MFGSRLEIARLLITLPALFLVIGPPLADFNATHVTHPDWVPHARLHTVWLVTTNSLVALAALMLLWFRRSPLDRASIFQAAGLAGAILAGFFVAAATQQAYGGALTDPGGIPFQVAALDANLAGFSVCALALIVAVAAVAKLGTASDAL